MSFLLIFFTNVVGEIIEYGEFKDLRLHRVSDIGTYFKPENNGVSLESSIPVLLSLNSYANVIEYFIQPVTPSTVTISIRGLKPSTKYYMYKDSYRNLTEFITDSSGDYIYQQELLRHHLVWIQTKPSTYFIRDDDTGGDCEGKSIGIWTPNIKTCTLTRNLNQAVEIESDNVTLDCNNRHIANSFDYYSGVFIGEQNLNVVKNCNITNPIYGIVVYYSNNVVLIGNNIEELEVNGAGISIIRSQDATVLRNTINTLEYAGIQLSYSLNNVISENIISNNYFGFLIVEKSNQNTFSNNTLFSNVYGTYLNDSNYNKFIQNKDSNSHISYRLYTNNFNNAILHNQIFGRRGVNIGVYVSNRGNNLNNVISYNSIVDNDIKGFENYQPEDVNALYNWWGTTDENEIQRKIYDYYDNNRSGIVHYSPWLNNAKFYLEITSPSSETNFNPREEILVEFEVKDSNGGYETGITQVEYKLKESDNWRTKNVNRRGVGKYGFSVEAPTEDGVHLLRVKTDINGSSVADSVVYNVLPTDLYIDSIKAVQVVEDVDLVSEKPTVVRVEVVNTGAPATFTTKLTYNEQDYYQTKTIGEKETLDFYPEILLSSGAYQITGEVDVDNVVPEINENNNAKTINVNVLNTKELDVVFRPIELPVGQFDRFEETKITNTEFIEATYPIGLNQLKTKINYTPHVLTLLEKLPFIGAILLIQNLYLEQLLSDGPDFDRVVGVVPSQIMEEILPGVAGLSSYLTPQAVLISPKTNLSKSDMRHATTHELGHTYDLCDEYDYCAWLIQNAYRTFIGGCPNPYPLSNCNPLNCGDPECKHVGNPDINGFWVDLQEEKKTNFSGGPYFFNLMGNGYALYGSCESKSQTCRWINGTSYSHLLEKFSLSEKPLPISEKQMIVRGSVHKNFDIQLRDFYVIEGTAQRVLPGDYSVELVDLNGQILSHTDFNVSFYFEAEPPIDLNITFFTFAVPFDENAEKVVFNHFGEIKAQKQISENFPIIQITSPSGGEIWSDAHTISWMGIDPDEDNLSYALEYSDDDGVTWQNIALDLNQTNYLWDVKEVNPSGNYKIRVTATDGVLTTREVSNSFVVQNPDISVMPFNWGFGKTARGTIVSQDFKITNNGNMDLTVFDIISSTDINVSGISLPLILPPQESHSFTATIDTLNIFDIYSGDININSNDPGENKKTISVDGNIQEIRPQVKVDITAPIEVNYPDSFVLSAIVTTQKAPIRDANITIVLPEGLSTKGALTIYLDDLFEQESKTISWAIDTNKAGVFEIGLTVSSINGEDFNTSTLISVAQIEVTNVSTAKKRHFPNEPVIMDTTITNFSQDISYTDMDLNFVIKGPQNSIISIHRDLNILLKNETQRISTMWLEKNKLPGNYLLQAFLYNSAGQLLDVNSTKFTVVPRE